MLPSKLSMIVFASGKTSVPARVAAASGYSAAIVAKPGSLPQQTKRVEQAHEGSAEDYALLDALELMADDRCLRRRLTIDGVEH